jgi:hypothetical protein
MTELSLRKLHFANKIFEILDLGAKIDWARTCPRNVRVHLFWKGRHSLKHVETHALLAKVDALKTLPHLHIKQPPTMADY